MAKRFRTGFPICFFFLLVLTAVLCYRSQSAYRLLNSCLLGKGTTLKDVRVSHGDVSH